LVEEIQDPDPNLVLRVDAAMVVWQQGDVVTDVPIVWLSAAPSLGPPRIATLETGSFQVASGAPGGLVVISQTCDIRRPCWSAEGKGRPFVQLSPLVRLTGEELRIAGRDFLPRYAPVPGAGNDAFADLDQCMTVEKSLLAGVEGKLVGCPTEIDQRRFARALARHKGRFAFPDGVDRSVQKLRDYLRDKQGKTSAQGVAVSAILEIRAKAMPSFDEPTGFQMTLVFVIDPALFPPAGEELEDQTPDFQTWIEKSRTIPELCDGLSRFGEPTDRYDLWQQIAAGWASKCEPHFPVMRVHGEAVSSLEYPIARARVEPSLDLEHMSSEEDRMSDPESFDGES
jgi:hypothetical protein